MPWLLVLAMISIAQAAQAQGIAARFPAGSLQTREAARQALDGVTAERRTNDQEKRAAEQHCLSVFLVTQCRDDARRKHDAKERDLRRVELEAHALQRKLDEDDRLKRRAEDEARRAAEAPKKEAEAAEARKRHAEREAESAAAKSRGADQEAAAAQRRKQSETRQAEHAREQAEAEAAAPSEAAEREANRKRLEERRAAAGCARASRARPR